jgi:YVTN family beta-propeller protein
MNSLRRIVWLGLLLGTVASSAHAARIYVSNEDGQSVSVIDAAKSEVVATIGMRQTRAGSQSRWHRGRRYGIA